MPRLGQPLHRMAFKFLVVRLLRILGHDRAPGRQCKSSIFHQIPAPVTWRESLHLDMNGNFYYRGVLYDLGVPFRSRL